LQSKSSLDVTPISDHKIKLSRLGSGASIKSGKDQYLINNEKLEVIEESMKVDNQTLSANAIGTQEMEENESYIDDIGGKVNEVDIIDLDKWLCEWDLGIIFKNKIHIFLDEIPLIQRSSQISDLFLKRENFEVLLAFVLDPRLYAVSEEVV